MKAPMLFSPRESAPAVMFRRKFTGSDPVTSAIIHVCALEYGYVYLNGKPVSEDLFCAPVSDYRKTLWYNSYDVSHSLKTGENVLAVICGNGWYNESFDTAWHHNLAPWRDNPKCIFCLEVNGSRLLTSDTKWKCTTDTPVIYNQLRSGEHFDARKYDSEWTSLDFDNASWKQAALDTTPPVGEFRPCPCEPIRAFETYSAVTLTEMETGRYIADIGQNISGFIRLTVDQDEGDEIVIRYAESLDENGELKLNRMNSKRMYPESAFQTDKLICPKGEFTWSPKFAYHGFRYIELTGIKNPRPENICGVFVHQAVKTRSSFQCSNEVLNTLFAMGQKATLSNLFYMPTDCPTREKLGWCNDAQSSAEQMLTNFETERVFAKWLQDIYDAMLPGGELPGIIPTSGWGFEWGNGPVSEGILFELPYRLYLHTGNAAYLIDSLPYFDRYFGMVLSHMDENGDISYGLDDWAHPYEKEKVLAPFINSAYLIKFYRIAKLAASLAHDAEKERLYEDKLNERLSLHKKKYMNDDGTCDIDKQTSVAMLIYHEIYDALMPLKKQLMRLVEEKAFHHDCGMVGIRHLYMALNKCGLYEYAYKIITAKGFPGYRVWLENGATTLCEMWDCSCSQNHHMYSDFMSWLMKTVIGIHMVSPAYEKVSISPCFFEDLTFAKGHIDTPKGRCAVEWEKKADHIAVNIEIPAGIEAFFGEQALQTGMNTFVL